MVEWLCFSVPVVKLAAGGVLLQEIINPTQFNDPELAELACALPGITVQDSAEKTMSTYVNPFCRWKE